MEEVDVDYCSSGCPAQMIVTGNIGEGQTMAQIDVTSKIERLEVFEERLGVTLDNLSAFVQGSDDGSGDGFLHVYGELQTRNGTELQKNVELIAAAYE